MVVEENFIMLKKLINNLLYVVDEVLEGIVVVNFGFIFFRNYCVIICEDVDEL